MTISTEFAPEGELEIWEFGSKGKRRRIANGLEPDEAVRLVKQFNDSEEQTRAMRKALEMKEPSDGPFMFKIVEHVDTRTVWEPP